MTTTVTSVTDSTVTATDLSGALALVTAVAALVLLVSKEVAITAGGERVRQWSKNLNVALIPLLIAFAVIVIVQVAGGY
jgi:hypothetical protein